VALTHDDLTELLEMVRAGGDVDVVRESVEMVLQALIEAEAAEVIGAAPHERTETRTNQRNGSRARLLSTKAGDVELRIPKLRKGSFFPAVLERRRRIDRALFAVVMEAYVHGVSTRKVDDLVAALGLEAGISKSEVSRICGELDEPLEAFRTRPLGHVEFPTCSATPPSSSAAPRDESSPKPSSWPPASPAKATAKSSALRWVTARTAPSGLRSCAASVPAASPGSSS
jgi:putative transposase